MKLYTKSGDDGHTGLIGGQRVPKDNAQVDCYGHVDELNAALGVAAASSSDPALHTEIQAIQSDLFILGAQLATEARREPAHHIAVDRITALERRIDEVMGVLPPLERFVLPGGSELSARFHVARTICRRTERAAVNLGHTLPVDDTVLVYLNRLSDLLFAHALLANRQAGVDDIEWIAPPAEA